jgi:hypothetical protein
MRRFFAPSIVSAGIAAACQSLPPTEPLAVAGAAGSAQAGSSANGGGAGNASAGTAGSSLGGTSGTAGTGASGGSSGSNASGGSGGTGGSSGDQGGEGGEAPGTGGMGGTGGSSGMGGTAGMGEGGDNGFFGDSRCSSDFLFCEDFEASSIDTDRWQSQMSGPAPALDTTRAARGMRSVHFSTEDNGLCLLTTDDPFPVANNRYYGRLFVWFDSMPTAPEWAHWSIAYSQSDSEDTEIRVGGQYDNTINRFGVGTDHGPTGDWTILDEDPGDPVPVRTWVCVEWLHDGQANVTDLWWDGVPRPSLHTTATDHGGSSSEEYLIPPIDSLVIGWWLYQAGTTPDHFDVWIDEVAIDDERIGCER